MIKEDENIIDSIGIFCKRRKYLIFSIVIFTSTALLFVDLVDGDWKSLKYSISNLSNFFFNDLWPPDWKILEVPVHNCKSDFVIFCSHGFIGIIDTLKMAFAATALGFALALPISILASRNLYDDFVAVPCRLILAAARTLPSLIWAIIFVIMVGLGAISGVLAMTAYTIGYLGKLQYEAIEGMSNNPLDAARAMGLSSTEIVFRVVIPECANNLISQLLFMFEYNVRHSSVIGIVGGVGVGYYLKMYLDVQDYERVMALLILLFIVVVIVDFISVRARSYFVEEATFRPKALFGNIFKTK